MDWGVGGGQRIRKHDRSGMGRIEDKMLSMGRMKGAKRDSEVDLKIRDGEIKRVEEGRAITPPHIL